MPNLNEPIVEIPPIARISSLASILETTEADILRIANGISSHYKPGKLLFKKDGTPRPTHDAKPELKTLHEHIKNRILKKVRYPRYLLGGISDPEYPRSCRTHAAIHTKKRLVISEDISNFFPNTDTASVRRIWQHCFRFHPQIASLLARLTTYENELPQGWKTSAYLSNLVFWQKEPILVEWLHQHGYSYSRFMDDITVSSPHFMDNADKSEVIKKIYGMLFSENYRPKRTKQDIASRKKPINITGLLANSATPTLPPKYRKNVRAAVHQLRKRFDQGDRSPVYIADWRSISGKVDRVRAYHKCEGEKLRAELQKICAKDPQ